jgi:hypothetical protein
MRAGSDLKVVVLISTLAGALNATCFDKTSASSCLVHVAEIYHVSSGLDI